MIKKILFFAIIIFFTSCKEKELVKKPNNLIPQEVMINIMYDLCVLEAIRYQNPTSIDTFKINSRDFIYKKYKIDSLQFVKSNSYYSYDYKEYKQMFDQVSKRIEKEKAKAELLVKLQDKTLKKQ